MNIPLYFNSKTTGFLDFYIPPITSSSSSSSSFISSSSSSSSIEVDICIQFGYKRFENECQNPIPIIVGNTVCYTCGVVSSSSSSSSTEQENPEPIYIFDPDLLPSDKKISLNYNGNIAAFGLTDLNYNYYTSGKSSVHLFKQNQDYSWSYLTKLTGNFDDQVSANFGNSLSFNSGGNILLVGAPGDNSAFIFTGSNTIWNSYKVQGLEGDFGYQVGLNKSGNLAFISAPENENGKVFVYSGNDINNWSLINTFSGDINSDLRYGHSLSINENGDLFVVGAPKFTSGFGAIYVNRLNNNTWISTRITGSNLWGFYGYNVALSKDSSTLLVNSILASGGTIHIYKSGINNSWNLTQEIVGVNNFGRYLDINYDGTIFSASNDDDKTYLFSGDYNNYNLIKLITGYKQPEKDFGKGLSLSYSGNYLGIFFETGVFVYSEIDLRFNNQIFVEDFGIKKYGDLPFQIEAYSLNTGTNLNYSIENTSYARINRSGITTVISPGITSLIISQDGTDDYKPAYFSTGLIIQKGNQNITFDPIPIKSYGDPPFLLNELFTDKDLPVTFATNNPSVLEISNNNTVFVKNAGAAQIIAVQSGDYYYNQAEPIIRTVLVNKADQSISFNPLKEYYIERSPAKVSVKSTSNLPVKLSSNDNNIVQFEGDYVAFLDTGVALIKAEQVGNDNYNPANPIFRRINIINEIKDCYDIVNIVTDCNCGNNCRNCCGIDASISKSSHFKNNKGNYNVSLSIEIYNKNCDHIADFFSVYGNNKLVLNQYYFVRKNNYFSMNLDLKDIPPLGDFIKIKVKINEFGRVLNRYLTFTV